jgi:cell division protease FtsH
MNANLRNFALWVIIVLLVLALFTLFQHPGQRTTGAGHLLLAAFE